MHLMMYESLAEGDYLVLGIDAYSAKRAHRNWDEVMHEARQELSALHLDILSPGQYLLAVPLKNLGDFESVAQQVRDHIGELPVTFIQSSVRAKAVKECPPLEHPQPE